MANSNYSQVIDLLAAARLNWQSDVIYGYLCTGATFDPTHKLLTDVAGLHVVAKSFIQGRITAPGGRFLGYPVFFDSVAGGETYQVLLGQDVGLGKINLLAFFDTSGDSDPLTQEHDGTFVLRPGPAEGFDQTTRQWMQV